MSGALSIAASRAQRMPDAMTLRAAASGLHSSSRPQSTRVRTADRGKHRTPRQGRFRSAVDLVPEASRGVLTFDHRLERPDHGHVAIARRRVHHRRQPDSCNRAHALRRKRSTRSSRRRAGSPAAQGCTPVSSSASRVTRRRRLTNCLERDSSSERMSRERELRQARRSRTAAPPSPGSNRARRA